MYKFIGRFKEFSMRMRIFIVYDKLKNLPGISAFGR